jgi:hypothetical protein
VNKKLFALMLIIFVCLIFITTRGGQAHNIVLGQQVTTTTANNWYVSPDGDDTNDCMTPGTACASVNAAYLQAVGGDTILIATGIYTQTVDLPGLYIWKSINLSGGWDESYTTQSGRSTIDGQRLGYCLEIVAELDVNITRFVFQNCGNDITEDQPYSILNSARLWIEDSILQESYHLVNYGELTLIGCDINSNWGDSGGGIYSFGPLILIRSSVRKNGVSSSGGGLVVRGDQTVIINSTISDNYAHWRGGAINKTGSGELKIYNSTIINNEAQDYIGGLYLSTTGTSMQNTILADNWISYPVDTSEDCYGTILSGGYNMIGNISGCDFVWSTGDLLNVTPHAHRLSTYYALLADSPAVDAANPDGCLDDLGDPILEDQLGSLRPMDGDEDGSAVCDIGAYEFDPAQAILFNYLPFSRNPCPLLYLDRFNDPASGWPIIDNGNSLLEYNNHEYRILARPAPWFIGVYPGFGILDMYKVSVDLRNVTGVEGSYGIIFGLMSDWSGWYTLEIYPDGWYGVYRYDQYGGKVLAEAYSPAIHQGTESNRISVLRDWASIEAYANGVLLVKTSDAYFTGILHLGLINISYSQPNVDIRYDNFKVSPLNCMDNDALGSISESSDAGWMEQANPAGVFQTIFTKHQP